MVLSTNLVSIFFISFIFLNSLSISLVKLLLNWFSLKFKAKDNNRFNNNLPNKNSLHFKCNPSKTNKGGFSSLLYSGNNL